MKLVLMVKHAKNLNYFWERIFKKQLQKLKNAFKVFRMPLSVTSALDLLKLTSVTKCNWLYLKKITLVSLLTLNLINIAKNIS